MPELSKIKELCVQKGITLKSIAEEADLTENGLQKIIKNNSTKIETLAKIAKALGTPITTFFIEGELAEETKVGEIAKENLHSTIANSNNLLNEYNLQKKRIEELKELLNDKNKIIKLLEKDLQKTQNELAYYYMQYDMPDYIEDYKLGKLKKNIVAIEEQISISYREEHSKEAYVEFKGKSFYETADKMIDWLVTYKHIE